MEVKCVLVEEKKATIKLVETNNKQDRPLTVLQRQWIKDQREECGAHLCCTHIVSGSHKWGPFLWGAGPCRRRAYVSQYQGWESSATLAQTGTRWTIDWKSGIVEASCRDRDGKGGIRLGFFSLYVLLDVVTPINAEEQPWFNSIPVAL